MKTIIFTIVILMPSFLVSAETLEGMWQIKIVSSGKDTFPWWQQIKYPTLLEVSKKEDTFEIKFTDQFDYKCSGKAMSVNNGRELVFEFCSGFGTKHDNAWGPIHHAKIINGQLHGTVTANQYLFKWVGKRVE